MEAKEVSCLKNAVHRSFLNTYKRVIRTDKKIDNEHRIVSFLRSSDRTWEGFSAEIKQLNGIAQSGNATCLLLRQNTLNKSLLRIPWDTNSVQPYSEGGETACVSGRRFIELAIGDENDRLDSPYTACVDQNSYGKDTWNIKQDNGRELGQYRQFLGVSKRAPAC